jgi:hypothetical protein
VERIRTLTQPFDLQTLRAEFAAQSTTLIGFVECGGVVRIVGAEDLSDAQVDALIAAHVPPTAEQIKEAEGQAIVDTNRALVAAMLYFRDRLNELRAQHSLAALTIAQVKQGIVDKYKAL